MSKKVGIVGLGAMGSAMAIMLVKAGYEVVGFDLRDAALDELEANGGSRAGSPRDVAEAADVVILSLPSIGAFEAVISGQGSVTSAGKDGLVLIDTCTMPVAVKEEGARIASDNGMTLIDGTVSGNRDMILAKTLTAYMSGEKAAYDEHADILSAFTRKHTFVGEFGNASKIKFVINHLVCVLTCANAEAMAMGLKAGLKAEDIFDLVQDSAAGSVLWNIRGPMMVSEDYTSSRGNFGMASKDGPVIGEFAQDMGFPAPLFQAALQMHHAAVGMGMYDIDTAALCRLYETMGGIER
ncbi:MAG: NAD(P)-dependent oxidoreductase [Alphaproteobacteria bacterium]|nr:NAD(P)-dependent oxidoreductase [Alphaproteobacteria bacterium]